MSTLANANENLANPLLYFSCWRPCQRGEGMIEGECIFKAQKKWHLVNLSTDKKLWKIYQNLLRLTHPLKDWPNLWKIVQNHWKKRVIKIFEKLISIFHFWILQVGEIGNQVFEFRFFLIWILKKIYFEVAQNRGVLIFLGGSSRFGPLQYWVEQFSPPPPFRGL